jgi:nucleoside-diphosphate-sugar epimerase
MRLLITGGAGFIGSNLCESLLAQGHAVTAVDNLITGFVSNIEHLLGHPRFQFMETDTVLLPHLEVDAVFHLASPASPVGYGSHPIETLVANSEGTRRVLDVTRQAGARFLLASTSEIYGDPLEHPQRETYFGNVDPVGPRSCYDEGKRYAEALTVAYGREYGVDARIVRIFNCYGPRNAPEDGRMVPTFVCQALRNEPITIYGDGRQTRSLCYVSDMVAGLEAAMFRPATGGGIFNLGNPQELTIEQFAAVIRELARSLSPIVHLEARPGEIARRRPDIERARRELGWLPLVGYRDGLTMTIDWYRSAIGERVPASAG